MAYRIRAGLCLVAGGLLMAATPAFAQEGMLFKELMEGVIGGGNRNNGIEYRQRPPLVVPPGSTLPRPQEPSSRRNAAWPNDPDVAARRAASDEALIPATQREKYREQRNPLLSQEELRRGRTYGGGSGTPQDYGSKTYEENIGPIRAGRDLAARQNATDLSNLTYGSEPERRYLYEPPGGYRRPAGTAALGPGADGLKEDKQALGQKEFAQGLPAPRTR